MIDDHALPEIQTITRTLTITTVETWTIAIVPGDAREEAVIDQVVEEAKLFSTGEEA